MYKHSPSFSGVKKQEDAKIEVDEDNVSYSQLKLPERLPDQNLYKPIRKEQVQTNCFKIRFDKNITIQQYEFKFYAQNRNGLVDLSTSPKTEVQAERRRSLLWKLFIQLLQDKTRFVDNFKYVFDCGCMVVTTEKLPMTNVIEQIELNADLLDAESRSILPKTVDRLWVEIKHVKEVIFDSAHLIEDSLETRDRSSLQLLDLVFNQKIISSDSFHVFPQKSFLKKPLGAAANEIREIQGRIMKDGLAKSVRVCGQTDSNQPGPGLMLLAEVAKSVFYPEKPLIDYLLTHFNCRDVRDLERFVPKLQTEIKRLTLITTHLGKNRIFICDGLDDVSAQRRTFSFDIRDEDGNTLKKRMTSVTDYFEDKYKIRISGNLPCVLHIVKRDGIKTKNYYPMDVLKIVAGQRVPLQKMDPRFQDNMIKGARMNPDQMKEATGSIMKAGFLTAVHPYARRFNVPMESSAIITEAIVLPPPAIQYGNKEVDEPTQNGDLSWRPSQNVGYLIGGMCDRWLVINFNGAVRDGQVLTDFLTKFVDTLKKRGTQITSRYDLIDERRFEYVKDEAIKRQVKFLLVITKDKRDPVHDQLKHFEVASKIITQHIWQQTVFDVARKNKNLTLENILFKTNEKLGGTNRTAITSKAFNNANPQLKNIYDKWLRNGRMFIGLELSHGVQGFANPASVIGMCYTYNEALSVKGHYFFQENRKTIISNLAKELKKPILEYKRCSERQQWPSHIFIYRTGVSEGEYLYLTAYEKSAVIQCLEEMREQHRDFITPNFTFIIAQKHNGIRLFPTTSNQNARRDADRNLKCGVCVTSGVTNPTLEQFVLNAHVAIQGTSRPIVFTVIADEAPKRTPREELIAITFALCHLHNDVNGTVHVPSVLYHASSLAKRGSNNMRVELNNPSSDRRRSPSDRRQSPPSLENPDKYADYLSEKLRTTFDSKFWA